MKSGCYRFGVFEFDAEKRELRRNGVTQQIDVTMEHNQGMKSEQFTWTRKGTIGRPLYHLGKREFYPAGAPDVRIRFTEDGNAIVMTVNDGNMTMTARRG